MRGCIARLFAGGAQPALETSEHDDALGRANDVLDFELKVLPLLAEPGEEAGDAVAAVELSSVGEVVRRAPVDVFIDCCQDRWDITTAERCVYASDYV